MSTNRLSFLAGALAPVALSACAAEGAFAPMPLAHDDADTGWAPSPAPPGDDLPPETEDPFFALPPASSDVYVFIANPHRDTLTRVHASTLEVRTVGVGNEPVLVLTTPDYRWAVSFNRLDHSVSVVEAATLSRVDVPVRPHFNQMKMSPDGNWVVLWHDLAARRPDDPKPDGVQSFHEVSFVNVVTRQHFPMAVGFNPRDVVFGAGLAAVVSDGFLATVDLGAPVPKPELIALDDELEPPRAEEVLLSRDGSWAFVRRYGTDALLVVDLLARTVDSVPVGVEPTDLDLSPDGAHAVVVARGSREIWRLDANDPHETPDVLALPGTEPLGSLTFAPGGALGVLYTTSGSDRYAVWDLATDTVHLRKLVKPVRALGITPTGDAMMVLHTKADAPDADPDSPFRGSWALTMVSLEDFRTNPLKLPAEPIGFANSTNGRSGYFVMEGEPLLAVVDYATLLPTEIRLKSAPVHLGVLPDLDPDDGDEPAAWVSQEHHLGRISFFDPDAGSLETITGFELNSQIED